MRFASSDRVVGYLASALTPERADTESLLRVATATLSRVRPGTWYAVVMCADPTMSQVVVADDSDPTLADYVRRYVASLIRPGYAPTTGMSQQVIETGEPLLIPRITVEEVFSHTTRAARIWFEQEAPPVEIWSAGTVVVPMRTGGQIVGTLGLWQWNCDPLDEADVRWMQPIADALAGAIAQGQIRSASISRLEQLMALQRIAFALTSSHELRLMVELILEEVVGRLRCDAADVLVYDEDSRELRVSAARGFHTTSVPEYRLPLPPELLEPASMGAMSEVVLCEANPIGRQQRRSLFAREGFTMYRAIPLITRRRLVGVLEVFNRGDLETDHEWLAFLKSIASHAAVAIEVTDLHCRIDLARGHERAAHKAVDLSRLDAKILELVANGATNSEIATDVNLSVHTVKFHVRRLLEQFDAANRTELAHKAIAQGCL